MYTFNEAGHAHFFSGKRMYGTTTVLSHFGDNSFLIQWAANCAVDHLEKTCDFRKCPQCENDDDSFWHVRIDDMLEARTAHTKKRDAAGDTGKTFHKVLEDAMNLWIEEGTPVYTEDDVANKVINWIYDNGYKPVKAELPCYSVTQFCAGILDILLEKEGKYYVGDFKTGNSIQPTAFIQGGAYAKYLREMGLYECSGVIVIHVPKGKTFNDPFTRFDIETLEKTWCNIFDAYKVYKELKEVVKPKYIR